MSAPVRPVDEPALASVVLDTAHPRRGRGPTVLAAVPQPIAPQPGRGPTMIRSLTGDGLAPLITPDVHALICGFTTTVRHPRSRTLAQCAGCRLWLHLPTLGGAR